MTPSSVRRTRSGDQSTINQSIKRWPGWALLALVAVALIAVGASRDRGDRTPGERIDTLERRLACPVCDGESVFDSRNRASNNIRNRITELVNEGTATDDEIVADVRRTYGEGILLLPKTDGVELVVWVLPVAAAVAGLAGLVLVFARWRRAGASDVGPTDDDRDLVAAALSEDEP